MNFDEIVSSEPSASLNLLSFFLSFFECELQKKTTYINTETMTLT